MFLCLGMYLHSTYLQICNFFVKTEIQQWLEKPQAAQCNISKGISEGRWVCECGWWLGYCSSAFAPVSLHQGGLPIRANTYDTLDSPAWTMAGDNRPLPAAQSMTYCPRVDVCLSKHTYTHPHATQSLFPSLYLSSVRVKCQLSVSHTEINKQPHTLYIHTLRKWLSAPFLFQTINNNFQPENKWAWWDKKQVRNKN